MPVGCCSTRLLGPAGQDHLPELMPSTGDIEVFLLQNRLDPLLARSGEAALEER